MSVQSNPSKDAKLTELLTAVDTLLAGSSIDAANFYLSESACLSLASISDDLLPAQTLLNAASLLRDTTFTNVVTYSKKVFFPLTHLCRDVCHYCTFAQTPKFIDQAYMPVDEVVTQALHASKLGCKEALFTLGEKPELRYSTARKALVEMGFSSTLEYVAHVADKVYEASGILPHINAGNMTREEMRLLKSVSASMGLMLESTSDRLCDKGMPHHGSPDKVPAVRLETLRLAGEENIPFTTGILIGIGETRTERIESLLEIRQIHQEYGHIQEIIIQNFRAKPETKMANAPEPDLNELLWTLAVARLIFGAEMSIQVPPNLSPGVLEQLVDAGINDWGGVSPVTPDFVNPEAPWPHLDNLAKASLAAGKVLHERLTVYPQYIETLAKRELYLDSRFHASVLAHIDSQGFVREDDWLTGSSIDIPTGIQKSFLLEADTAVKPSTDVANILSLVEQGQVLSQHHIIRLFSARGDDFTAVIQAANALRHQQVSNAVSFTVNRNINYTNICYFKCKFCAFSKGKLSENLRGKPYDLSEQEIKRRTIEAWDRGATEVCMQGGIHPSYTGQTYLDICRWVKEAVPQMHVHAFSPLEIWHGAASTQQSLEAFLSQLKEAGLASLPGTAAEVLDDQVREELCSDKVNTEQWLEVMRVAHGLGIRSTATIMFGHIDGYEHWANHLLSVRELQEQTGGFTEFVPLPFVASESPIALKGQSRLGPTLRESILMHSIARLVLGDVLPNIQASWVKLGEEGVKLALNAGANDIGGTLMNESITRSAGAQHGEFHSLSSLEDIIQDLNRDPKLRTTLYQAFPEEQAQKARNSLDAVQPIELTASEKPQEKVKLLRPGETLSPLDLKEA